MYIQILALKAIKIVVTRTSSRTTQDVELLAMGLKTWVAARLAHDNTYCSVLYTPLFLCLEIILA